MTPMILTLCEYASNHNGKLTIIDTFDVVAATKFPWRAYFYVAAKIDIMDTNVDFKKMLVRIVPLEDSEKDVCEITNLLERSKKTKKLCFTIGFKGLIFSHPGKYSLRIFLDDTLAAECPFKVILKNE